MSQHGGCLAGSAPQPQQRGEERGEQQHQPLELGSFAHLTPLNVHKRHNKHLNGLSGPDSAAMQALGSPLFLPVLQVSDNGSAVVRVRLHRGHCVRVQPTAPPRTGMPLHWPGQLRGMGPGRSFKSHDDAPRTLSCRQL